MKSKDNIVSSAWIHRKPLCDQNVMLMNVEAILIAACNQQKQNNVLITNEEIQEYLSIMRPSSPSLFNKTLLNIMDAKYEVDGMIINPVKSVTKTSDGFHVELNDEILYHWSHSFLV